MPAAKPARAAPLGPRCQRCFTIAVNDWRPSGTNRRKRGDAPSGYFFSSAAGSPERAESPLASDEAGSPLRSVP